MTTAPAAPILPAEPLSALRYRLHLRISDVIAGRRDGSLDLARTLIRPDETETVDPAPTSWLRNNEHQFTERSDAELLAAHSAVRELIQSRRALVAELPGLEAARAAAEHALEASAPELAEAAAQQRGATEKHLGPDDVATRRRREHAAARSLVEGKLTTAAKAVDDQLEAITRFEAAISTAFEQLVGRVERLREFHNRRAAAYERAYLRRLARGGEHITGHPLAAHRGLAVPAWCAAPCPWLNDVRSRALHTV